MSTQSCYHCQIFIHSRFLFHQMYLYKIPSIFFIFKITNYDLPAFLIRSHNCLIYKGYVCVSVYKPLSSFQYRSNFPVVSNVQKCCSNIQFSDICRFFLLNIEKTISNVCSTVLFIVLMLKQVHISLHFKTNWPLELSFSCI